MTRLDKNIDIYIIYLMLFFKHLFLSKDYQPYPILKVALHIRQFRIALIQTLVRFLSMINITFVCFYRSNISSFINYFYLL